MPLFEYRCQACGHAFEKLVRVSPGPSVLACPVCDETTATRQLSTFATPSGTPAACGPAPGG